jgi:outer membrane protein TolC
MMARRLGAILVAASLLVVIQRAAGGSIPIGATQATAQAPTSEADLGQLSLEAIVQLAVEHSPKLKEARVKVLLARLEVRATAWWTWLIPSVTAQQGYDLLAQQQRAAVALSLDLSKLLGKGAQEAERARLGLTQSEHALEAARNEVIAEVTKAVFHRDATREAVAVREKVLAHALKLHALHSIRFNHGSDDLPTLLHAEASLARAQLDLQAAQHEAHLAGLNLRRVVGLPLP